MRASYLAVRSVAVPWFVLGGTSIFAGLRYLVQSLTAFDTPALSRSAGVEISGFLGAAVLRRMTLRIDYRDDLIDFKYDPKRLTPCMKDVYREDCY